MQSQYPPQWSPERHPTFGKALLIPVLLLAAAVQCSTDPARSTDSGGDSRSVALVSVAPAPGSFFVVGWSDRFVATAFTSAGDTVRGVTFAWTSSDPRVAVVSQTGLVTAIGVGSATITASAPNAVDGTASAAVVGDFAVLPSGVSLSGAGSTTTLRAVDGRTQQPLAGGITWASLNPAVAAVDGAGVVTAW